MSVANLPAAFPLTARASGRARRVWKILFRVTLAAVLVTGLIGVLHMPFAASLLRKISPAWACPIRRGTPEQIDRGHAMGAANIRAASSLAAPSRPALGFSLDVTTLGDIRAWAAKNAVTCGAIGGNENLQKCTKVPSAAVGQPASFGALDEITFEVRKTGELVNVQTMRRGVEPGVAAAMAAELEARAAKELGAPSQTGGEPTASHLSRGVLSTYVAVHQFTDYRATISATNLAKTGIMVREEYISARE